MVRVIVCDIIAALPNQPEETAWLVICCWFWIWLVSQLRVSGAMCAVQNVDTHLRLSKLL